MPARLSACAVVFAASVGLCASLRAQTANAPEILPPIQVTAKRPTAKKPARRPHTAAARTPVTRPAVPPSTPSSVQTSDATSGSPGGGPGAGVPPIVTRYQLPQKSFSITAKEIEQTINLKDPEDAVKYFPGLFVRKRNDGDNQAVLATRTWGLNSSARTLIYDDDLLISALIGNNNSGASPHWNLVSPDSIARIDFLNGPYAAMYPGNSIGGVLLITTKMPDKFEIKRQGNGLGPALGPVRHQKHLCDQPDQRVGRRPQWRAVMARQRQLSRRLPAAPDLHDQRLGTRRDNGNHRRAEQARRRCRRRRDRRAHPHAADDGQSQGRLRSRSVGPRNLFIGNLEQRPDLQPADLSDLHGDRRPDIRRGHRVRQQRIYLESGAHEQCRVDQERHQGHVRFRYLGIEL